jgi:4,4'-diaponeurosporenoate glycosyltransferase
MYPSGVGQLVEGWTKNLMSGVRLVDPVAASIAVWWVASCLALGAGSIAVLVRSGGGAWQPALVAAAIWTAVTLQLRWILSRIGSFGWWTAVLHPIVLWAFVGIFVRSVWLTSVRRTVRWRGRSIAVDGRRT